ncbi:MAG: glutamate-5-semialdehyde dehydrogenase [Deltaproteobacteria bacterium]|nr:glutamate-5-semialdehyde dehydrogenase [Deltaproteobacteria bacterium]
MTESSSLDQEVAALAREAKAAARLMATAGTAVKDAVLRRVAHALVGSARAVVLEANARDMRAGEEAGLSPAMLDRLRLDGARLDAISAGLREIMALPDPVGRERERRTLPNGIELSRMGVPLGLVAMIYESRPNVTIDAGALTLKSGNAVILRGGKEAFESNRTLAAVFSTALESEGLPAAAVTLLPTTDRRATLALIQQAGVVDLVIPRGGEGLIRFVSDNARVPVLQHFKGVCHVYVDASADLEMATRVVLNSKAQRPGVCNALETLLVDARVADAFLPRVARELSAAGVALRGDEAVRARVPEAEPATEADWDTEYLDLVLSIAVVADLDGALSHISRHGSGHTECIVTEDAARAERFLREADASLVLVNASTRFNDGSQLGLGAEIGISTTKLHAYGPMGLEQLCSSKWVGRGAGQIRG